MLSMADQLNSAIYQVNAVRRHLSQNASEVKLQIHAAISRNLEALRNREVWLLNQVDVIVNMKEDSLQKQQARLNQQLGVVSSQMKHIDDTLTTEPVIDGLKPDETPFIIFKSESSALRDSIVRYGRIDGNGFMDPQTAFIEHENPSTSLPRPFEDYDDGDHMMCYKTVQPLNSATKINVRLPKISMKPGEWLANSTATVTTSSTTMPKFSFPTLSTKTSDWLANGAETSLGPNELKPLPRSDTSSSIKDWLQQIKNNPVGEEEDDFEVVRVSSDADSYTGDMVDITKSGDPEFVKIDSEPSSMQDPWSQFFVDIREDMDKWLVNDMAYTVNEKSKSVKSDSEVSSPVKVDMGMYASNIAFEQDEWLKCSEPHQSNISKSTKQSSHFMARPVVSEQSLLQNDGVSSKYRICDSFKRYLSSDLSPWLRENAESANPTTKYSCPLFKQFTHGNLKTEEWLYSSKNRCGASRGIPDFACLLRMGEKEVWLKEDSSPKIHKKKPNLVRNTSFESASDIGSPHAGLCDKWLLKDATTCSSERSFSLKGDVDVSVSKWLSKDSLQNM